MKELSPIQESDQLRTRIEKVRQIVAPELDDQELVFFLEYCKQTGLDPVTRQIYATKRRSKKQDGSWEAKVTIGTSIDGQRLVAERTGKYEGQLGPFWCGKDGKWKDVWLDLDNCPSAARVGVLRSGFKEPLWGVAVFESYAQRKQDGGLTSMWDKMPDVMIAKCAEALALRKAFPNELSGLYEETEMGQADNPDKEKSKTPTPVNPIHRGQETPAAGAASSGASPKIPTPLPQPLESSSALVDPKGADRLRELAAKHNWKGQEVVAFMRFKWQKAMVSALTLDQFQDLETIIQKCTYAQAMGIPIPKDYPREPGQDDEPPPHMSGSSLDRGYDPSFDEQMNFSGPNQ